MSEYRRNPVTGEWVIVAPARAGRPLEVEPEARARPVEAHVPSCPFCPGNEAETPPPVLVLPDGAEAGGWQVRAFPNKYAAVSAGGGAAPAGPVPLLEAAPAVGAHEVVVETPHHDRVPADWSVDEAVTALRAYRARYRSLVERREIRYVLVFKNHGRAAGTSLEHPHSQILATNRVPDAVARRRAIAREAHERSGRCLLCRVVEAEMAAGVRIVDRDDHYVLFHPFGSARPGETWLVPLEHASSFAQTGDAGLERLAPRLTDALRRLRATFGDPDYNYWLESVDGEAPAAHHWCLRIVPHLARAAGFELASGMQINTLAPEDAAERMRRASGRRA